MTSLRFVRLFYNLTSYTGEAQKGDSGKLIFIFIKFFSIDTVKVFIIIDSYTFWVFIVLLKCLYIQTPLSFLIIQKTRNILDTVFKGFYFIFYLRYFLKNF